MLTVALQHRRTVSNVPFTLTRFVFLPYAVKLGPAWFRQMLVNVFPWGVVQELNGMVKVMHDTSTEIFEAAKRSLSEGNSNERIGGGKDIMTILRLYSFLVAF